MFFKISNLQSLSGVPVNIPVISGIKGIEGTFEPLLALIVSEVIPLEVVDKHIVFDIRNALYLPTLIYGLLRYEQLGGRMSDYFASCGSPFCSSGHIVVALDPEGEVALPGHHLVVLCLVVIESLDVLDIALNVATAAGGNQVDKVGTHYHPDGTSDIQKHIEPDRCNYQARVENKAENHDCQVKSCLSSNREVSLGESRVSNIEEHVSETI